MLLGGKLEAWINGRAKRQGRTPAAVKNQLAEIGKKLTGDEWDAHRRDRPYGDFSELSVDDVRLMNDFCRLIVCWVR